MRFWSLLMVLLLHAAASPSAVAFAQSVTPSDCVAESCWQRMIGWPEIRNFNTTEIGGGSTQNWFITQDEQGLLYVGNNSRLLQFDGVNWRSYVPNGLTVLSVAPSGNRLYYGSNNLFGMMVPDSIGNLRSIPLHSRLPAQAPPPNSVWAVAVHGEDVYFRDQSHLYQWRDSLISWQPMAGLARFHAIGEKLYVYESQRGIAYVEQGQLRDVPGGSAFQRRTVYAILPGSHPDALHIITRSMGIDRLTPEGKTTVETPIHDWLRTAQVYAAIALRQGGYAIGSLQDGLIITDDDFQPLLHLTTENGLIDNGVLTLYQDHENGIWVGTNNGLSRIIWPPRFTTFDNRSGIPQSLHRVFVSGGKLFAGGTTGVFVSPEVDPSLPFPSTNFRQIDEINGFVNVLIEVPAGVVAGTDAGAWLITENDTRKITGTITRSAQYDPQAQILFLLGIDVIRVTRVNGDEILPPRPLFETPVQFREMILRGQTLWVTSRDTLVRRLTIPSLAEVTDWDPQSPPLIETPAIKSYSMPAHTRSVDLHMHVLADTLYFANASQLFRYDAQQDSLVKASLFTETLQNGRIEIFKIVPSEAAAGVFVRAQRRNWVARKGPDGLYQPTNRPLNRMYHPSIQDVAVQGPLVWYAGNLGLTLYNTTITDPEPSPFTSLIRQVTVRGDSIIFRGHYPDGYSTPILSYAENDMRFSYAALTFDKQDSVRYQTRLDPYDADWSRPTDETRKDYTGLPEGIYTFRVRSVNIDGIQSAEATYIFRILPPWYRTWWAYLLFLCSGGGLLYAGYQYRVNYLIGIERARQAIARDLHDEVSATLSSISFFAESMKLTESPQLNVPMIDKISFNAKDAQDKIQDIIWSASPEHDTWEGFLPKLYRFTSDLCESREIEYHLVMPPQAPEGDMDMYFRKDFWLMYKEMLTNAVRHSGCTRIEVEIGVTGGRITLRISDNGKGFDPNQRTSRNGVKNIYARAKNRNASIDLNTAPGNGTVWVLSMKYS
jgi:signal transduction histidine kinase